MLKINPTSVLANMHLSDFYQKQYNVQANSESVQCGLFQTWQLCLRMSSKCINSTSCRKYVTGNWFRDINFLHDMESFTVRRCFSSILAFFTSHAQFRPYYYFQLKSDVIFELRASVNVTEWSICVSDNTLVNGLLVIIVARTAQIICYQQAVISTVHNVAVWTWYLSSSELCLWC